MIVEESRETEVVIDGDIYNVSFTAEFQRYMGEYDLINVVVNTVNDIDAKRFSFLFLHEIRVLLMEADIMTDIAEQLNVDYTSSRDDRLYDEWRDKQMEKEDK